MYYYLRLLNSPETLNIDTIFKRSKREKLERKYDNCFEKYCFYCHIKCITKFILKKFEDGSSNTHVVACVDANVFIAHLNATQYNTLVLLIHYNA